jgi:Xaa-Pro dipeptidase
MSTHSIFPKEELNQRLSNVRSELVSSNLDGIVITIPENIYYLTELDHLGFFACHLLVVPREGEMILVCRAMEKITFENQVKNALFFGHADHEDPADYIVSALSELKLLNSKIGIESKSLFLTSRLAESIKSKTPNVHWQDASNLVSGLRIIKSPLEMDFVRKAAKATDAGMLAAINSIKDGASDYEVSAECSRAMILAGSEHFAFGPFIRPTSRLGEEHTTWRGEVFKNGDAVFIEIAANYRKYQSPMGRLVYVGSAPKNVEKSVKLAIDGMKAINNSIKPGAKAGDAYAAWREVGKKGGLENYERHHCGYLVSIGFPPSWTGGSMVTALAPNSQLELKVGMTFHTHSWFTNTDCVDYFISNTSLLTENGCEVLTNQTPETLIIK